VSRVRLFSAKRRGREALSLEPEKDAGHRDECHDGLLFPPEQQQSMRGEDESQEDFFYFRAFKDRKLVFRVAFDDSTI
jgi:hypothetical protein